jgi:hypothetical protein
MNSNVSEEWSASLPHFNREEATNFLTEYFKMGNGFVELRAFHDSNRGAGAQSFWITTEQDIADAVEWAQRMNAEGRGIFYSVLPRSERRGTKEAVPSMPAVFADLDCVKLGIAPDEAERQVLEAKDIPRPAIINKSGNGLHLIWFLSEPLTDFEHWERLQRGVQERLKSLGADPAVVGDRARVFRLPGTLNLKDAENPKPVKNEWLDTDERCAVDALPKAAGRGLKATGGFRLPDEIPEGGTVEHEGRNSLLFREGCALRGRGYGDAEILAALSALNDERCIPPLSAKELEGIVEQAAKYPPGGNPVQGITRSGLGVPLGELWEMQLPDVPTLIFGLSRGEVGMIQAPPGLGKTLLARNLMIAAATGTAFLEIVPEADPLRVFYWDAETLSKKIADDLKVMLAGGRFDDEQIGLAGSNITVRGSDWGDPLSLTQRKTLDQLEAELRRLWVDLLILDTRAKVFPGVKENDNTEVDEVIFGPLERLAVRLHIGVLLVHHVGKVNEGSGFTHRMMRGRGASSAAGSARVIYDLDPKGEGVVNLAVVKDKTGNPPAPVDLRVEGRWWTPVDTPACELKGDGLTDDQRRLLQLADKPMGKTELDQRAAREYGKTPRRWGQIRAELPDGSLAELPDGRVVRAELQEDYWPADEDEVDEFAGGCVLDTSGGGMLVPSADYQV